MFRLHHIQPAPLRGLFHSSEVWDREIAFEKEKKYLVIAPSGKGKSTFLHILYGLRNDFEGEFYWDSTSQNGLTADIWSDYRTKVFSIVFQDLRLFEDLTALQNIQVKNRLTDFKTDAEILHYAGLLEINDLLHKQVSRLSYGQKQRVAIIRALCQPFEFLLLDEPFSHLDTENTNNAKQLILSEVEKQGAGVILTSLGEDFGISFDYRISL